MWHLFIIELPSLDVNNVAPTKEKQKEGEKNIKKKKIKTVKGNCLWWS